MKNIDQLREVGCIPGWLIAVVLPAACGIAGWLCVSSEKGFMPGYGVLVLTGKDAILLGICLIAFGSFLFSRYGLARAATLSAILQVASLAALCLAAFNLCLRVFFL